MTITLSRRTAALAGAALATASLPLLSAVPAAVAAETPATTTYTKTLNYVCDVTVNLGNDDIVLDGFPVVADVSFAVPALKPNAPLDPTAINVDLTLPEDLRDTTVGLLRGLQVEGQSSNVYLFVDTAEGARRAYTIPTLSAAKSDIPQEKGAPWTIKATGSSPKIRIPTTSAVTVFGPEKFDIAATIYAAGPPETTPGAPEEPTTQQVALSCHTKADRTVATIQVGEKTTVTPRLPASVKARTDSSFRTEVRGASTLPTGSVVVYLENGDLAASGTLNGNGDVRLKLPKFGKLGKRTLTVVYTGDDNHGAVTVTKSLTVTR